MKRALRAQCGAALLSGEDKCSIEVEPGGIDAHQFVAEHRVEERRAGGRAGLPAAGDKVRKEFAHGVSGRGIDGRSGPGLQDVKRISPSGSR